MKKPYSSFRASLVVSAVGAALAMLAASVQAQSASAGNAAAGAKKVDMCIGCHGIPGYQASFPEVYKVPMIAGQDAKYIVSALTSYKKGDRRHPTMRAVATSLTDQDMADVAAYYQQLGQKAVAGETVPDTPAAPPANVAALLQRGNCASCHGANFNKPIDPTYPRLAGQHPDYLYIALEAYQTDANLSVFGRNNAIMKGMAKPFTHAELKLITEYLGSLPGQLRTVEQSHFRHSD